MYRPEHRSPLPKCFSHSLRHFSVLKMELTGFIDKKDLKDIKNEDDLYLLFNLNQDHVNHINHLLKKI